MATSKNRDARALVGFHYDAVGEKQYAAGLARIDAEQKSVARSAALVNSASSTLARGYRQLDANTYELIGTTDSWADNLEHLRAELIKTQDIAEKGINVPANGGAAAGTQRNVGSVERLDRFGTIGSQIAGAFGGSEAGNALGLVGDLASGFTALGPAGLAAAAGVTALTVVMGELERQSERLRVTTSARIRAERDAESFTETATTSELLERRAELASLAEDEAQQLAQLRGELNSFLDSLGLLDAAFAYSNVFLSTNRGTVNAYNEAITASEAALTDLNTQQVILNEALISGTTATADAIAAERELAVVRGQLRTSEQDAFIEGLRLSDEELQQRITSLQAERDAIQQWIDITQPQSAELENLTMRQDNLTSQMVGYTYAMQENVDIVQQADAATKQLTGGIAGLQDAATYSARDLADALENTRKAQDAVSKAQSDLANTEAKNAAEIESARQEKLENELKITEKYNLDTKRAAEDLADDLKKIRDDERFDVLNAVGERDAKAAYLARMNADKEANDAEDAARKERGRQKEDYEKELRAAKLTGQKRIDLEIAQGRAEVDAKRAALITTQNDLAKAQGTQQLIYRTGYGVMLSEAEIFSQRMQQAIKKAFILPTGSSKSGTGKNTTVVNAINGIVDARMNSTLRAAGS